MEEYQVSRKPNGDAIADLAKKNFIEMRDLVADPMFLLRKKIAQQVSIDHPDKFTPVYSLVSFSNISYSDALKEGERQDNAFDEILSWKDVEKNWQTEYYGEIVELLTSK
jgi:kynurenine 3-monooxygenase